MFFHEDYCSFYLSLVPKIWHFILLVFIGFGACDSILCTYKRRIVIVCVCLSLVKFPSSCYPLFLNVSSSSYLDIKMLMGFCYHMCPLLGNPFFIHGYVPSFILYGSGPCVFFFSLHIFSLTYCMCILFSSVYILLCRNTLLIHRFVLYVFFLW